MDPETPSGSRAQGAGDPAAETLAYLAGLVTYGIKLGLHNTQAMVAALGQPQLAYRTVHVAGTNGKGSVCSLLANALRLAGLRTGLSTSPHLVTVRERIRVDGRAIDAEAFANLVAAVRRKIAPVFPEPTPSGPTYFEFLTVAAMYYFQQMQVAAAVFEVGMGGRLDATNVLTPELAVITSIDFDHTAALGKTLAEIAGEKAGIIKPGVPVICGAVQPEAADRIEAVAAERGSPCRRLGRDFAVLDWQLQSSRNALQQQTRVRIGARELVYETALAGPHQAMNVAIAAAAVAELQDTAITAAAGAGFAGARWPGRLQFLADDLILDAAHNEDAVVQLTTTLRRLYPERRWHLLFAVAADKPWQPMLRHFRPLLDTLLLPQTGYRRATPVAELAAFVTETWPELPVETFTDLASAWSRLRTLRPALIAGSIYLGGGVLALLQGEADIPVHEEGSESQCRRGDR